MAAIDYKVSEDGPEFNWSIENSNIEQFKTKFRCFFGGYF